MTGFVPRPTQIPSNGQASFSGSLSGLISEVHIDGGADYGGLLGTVAVNANFATRTITGQISGIQVGSDGSYVTGSVNALTFTATYDAASNLYVGEIVTGASPGGPNAFQAGARGTIKLQLFGPTASEIGGAFVISDGQSRVIGAFGTRR